MSSAAQLRGHFAILQGQQEHLKMKEKTKKSHTKNPPTNLQIKAQKATLYWTTRWYCSRGLQSSTQTKLLQLLLHVITKYRAHQYKLPHFQSGVLIVISPGWQKRPALALPGKISSFFFPPNLTKSTSIYEGTSSKMYLITKRSTSL